MNNNRKRALVTGGAGFIGSNIVKYLTEENWYVRVVDNLSSGYAVNLDGLNTDFVKGDICNGDLMLELCEKVDVVFHLAASVGRQKSLEFPQQDSATNLLGTINLLEAIRLKGVKRLVYSSSAAIYGELESSTIA
ncbi:MAG: NAD-dependent epimerase/dehydratase family protein, partial [Dethiobacteria bacterium]|nr:NAD-dependent epimerase/dehydratase family protein [Dethiobacteria bacterium]